MGTILDSEPTDTARLAGRIRKALYGILDNYENSLHGGNGGTSLGLIHTAMESRLPVSAAILDTRSLCCARLAAWSLLVLEERDLRFAALSAEDPHGLARFLVVHADYLGEHEAAEDALDELRESAHDLQELALPTPRDWMPIGECPIIIGEDPCGATVRAYTDRHFIRCPRCETEDTLAWWMSQILPAGGSDVAAADTVIAVVVCETFRPISHAQLRQWAARGFIARHGKDQRGRTLYSSRAVLAYATDRQREEAPADVTSVTNGPAVSPIRATVTATAPLVTPHASDTTSGALLMSPCPVPMNGPPPRRTTPPLRPSARVGYRESAGTSLPPFRLRTLGATA